MVILPIVSCWTPSTGIAELRKRLSAAYPFGERKYWPYKVWCEEVTRTLNLLRAQHEPSPRDRPCGTCGAKPGKQCRTMVSADGSYLLPEGTYHEARSAPPSGPLFDTPIEKR